MLRSFSVRNFRCLEDLELHNLARVNVLVGDNDVGKTALLEALYAHLSQANVLFLLNLKTFRRSRIFALDETIWQDLFFGLDDSKEIHVSSVDANGMERSSKITVGPSTQIALTVPPGGQGFDRLPRPGFFRPLRVEYRDAGMQEPLQNELALEPDKGGLVQKHQLNPDLRAYYFSTAGPPESQSVASHLSELLIAKQRTLLVRLAKVIDERIQDLSVASPKGVTEVFVDLGEPQLLPLTLMGSGVVRALGIASAIPAYAGGIVLVDEIEDGIYYKRLNELWSGIYEMSKTFDVQIVASTHSAECVSGAIEAVVPDLQDADPLHVYRLDRGQRLPVPYERESLESVKEFLAEVR